MALNASGKRYGLSITLPASYWYLRGFDLQKIEPHLDFFNVMTYDIRKRPFFVCRFLVLLF